LLGAGLWAIETKPVSIAINPMVTKNSVVVPCGNPNFQSPKPMATKKHIVFQP